MRIGQAFAGILLAAGLLSYGVDASAHPPADDFLNVQKPGPRLTLMPFVGPGFRAIYDHRFEIEKDMSEIRTQIMGTVAIPFSEVSANIDARFFVMSFGASIGYHNEWHVLQFNPDPMTGRDNAGQEKVATNPPVEASLAQVPGGGFSDLHRDARAMKDEHADVLSKNWLWYEGRWQFVWPAYNFIGVSQLGLRNEDRPDVTFDWENGTPHNGGWHLRWEAYLFFRERNVGFIGPAFRFLYVPRNRVLNDFTTPSGQLLEAESACQPNRVVGQTCYQTHEAEFHYGIIGGLRPNWVASSDTFLLRIYTAYGLGNELFGTQTFRQPLQILAAYMVDVDL